MAKQQFGFIYLPWLSTTRILLWNSFVTNSTAKNEWIPFRNLWGVFQWMHRTVMRWGHWVAKVAKFSWFPNWYSLNIYLGRLPPPSTKSCCFGIFSNAPLVTFHPGSWTPFAAFPTFETVEKGAHFRGSGIHPLGFSWRRWTDIQHQPHKFTQ